jgi:hypothetical protein
MTFDQKSGLLFVYVNFNSADFYFKAQKNLAG